MTENMVGKQVRCVDVGGGDLLKNGRIYTVLKQWNRGGGDRYAVEGCGDAYASRFVPVTPVTPVEPEAAVQPKSDRALELAIEDARAYIQAGRHTQFMNAAAAIFAKGACIPDWFILDWAGKSRQGALSAVDPNAGMLSRDERKPEQLEDIHGAIASEVTCTTTIVVAPWTRADIARQRAELDAAEAALNARDVRRTLVANLMRA